MTCRNCRHEFCWICSAPWVSGCYNCNRFKSAESANAVAKVVHFCFILLQFSPSELNFDGDFFMFKFNHRQKLSWIDIFTIIGAMRIMTRYLYFPIVFVHLYFYRIAWCDVDVYAYLLLVNPSTILLVNPSSMSCVSAQAGKFAARQREATERRMAHLQEVSADNSWMDVQFLKVATEQLIEVWPVHKYYCFVTPFTAVRNIWNISPKLADLGCIYFLIEFCCSAAGCWSLRMFLGIIYPIRGRKVCGMRRINFFFGFESHEFNESLIPTIHTTPASGKLKWTEVLFEYLQEQLERNTEHLSELSEKTNEEMDRSEIINYTRVTSQVSYFFSLWLALKKRILNCVFFFSFVIYVVQFLKNLLDGVAEGLTGAGYGAGERI